MRVAILIAKSSFPSDVIVPRPGARANYNSPVALNRRDRRVRTAPNSFRSSSDPFHSGPVVSKFAARGRSVTGSSAISSQRGGRFGIRIQYDHVGVGIPTAFMEGIKRREMDVATSPAP